MPEGTGTFAVWAHNRFLAYDYCRWGSPNSHITLWVVFYAIGILLLLYRPVNRLYYLNCSRRKVNVVSHLVPVSVWSIVSRKIILLPAELIPLPEEANRSRP